MNGKPEANSESRGWFSHKLVLIGFLAVAAYFLWTEHRAHVVQFLPYGLLLLCPLLHFFHGGHGGHGGGHDNHGGGEGK